MHAVLTNVLKPQVKFNIINNIVDKSSWPVLLSSWSLTYLLFTAIYLLFYLCLHEGLNVSVDIAVLFIGWMSVFSHLSTMVGCDKWSFKYAYIFSKEEIAQSS